MGMCWIGYDTEVVGKVGRNTFVVTVRVYYLAVETNTPKYRTFYVLK
jgi:hypothetical protein